MIWFIEIWLWLVVFGLIVMTITIDSFLYEMIYLLFGRNSLTHFLFGVLTIMFGAPYVLIIWLIGNFIDILNWILTKLLIIAIVVNKSLKSNKYDKSSQHER